MFNLFTVLSLVLVVFFTLSGLIGYAPEHINYKTNVFFLSFKSFFFMIIQLYHVFIVRLIRA